MRLFGTDGIRGKPWEEPLDRDTIIKIGYVVAKRYPKMLLIRDTRNTGEEIEKFLSFGIGEAGGEAISSGVLPTSSLSFLVPKFGFSGGISISASHNPFWDNGIKIFGPKGKKLSEREEMEIEEEILSLKLLRVKRSRLKRKNFQEEYENFLVKLVEGDFKGLKVVLDSGNGANYIVAKEVFSRLGATVKDIGEKPDGRNINITGAIKPSKLSWKVKSKGAFIGFGYDGDGDRCIWVDEKGRVLSGDHTLYLFSRDFSENKKVWNKLVIGTIMSNLALEKELRKMGVNFLRTKVGDRYVLKEMERRKSILGGEQSGHTIFREHLSTGDGLLTSLLILSTLLRRGEKPSVWYKMLKPFPQCDMNLPVRRKENLKRIKGFSEAVENIKRRFKGMYFVVRFSGTENLLRLMVQGKDKEKAAEAIRELSEGIKEILKKEKILEE